jgi:uncharacterized membrane protein YphA (DoxX/SURF4 family)
VSDARRISAIAVVMLIVLRITIGWQLLYEGMWKIDTLKSPRPWTAAGYLKNSQGPFRDTFRNMAGDPDELDWLNYDVVAARWDDQAARLTSHYGLDDRQKGNLHRLLNGLKDYRAELDALPEGVDLNDAGGFVEKVISFNAKDERLIVSNYRLQTKEKVKLLNLVEGKTGPAVDNYKAAVEKVYKAAQRPLCFKEKLAAAVRGNPDVVGNKKLQYVGELSQYQAMLREYNSDAAVAKTEFQRDHLDYTWKEIQGKRASLTGPVKAMDTEFHDKALAIVTVDQLKQGAVPEPWTTLRISNLLTIVGLTVLGALVIVGLFTRLAAVTAAFMLFIFYLVMPPWPGVPAIAGPEHSFIVNKNLIEVVALIAIATTASGIWFGLDGILTKRKLRRKAVKS